jgi:predicted dehydrogenase
MSSANELRIGVIGAGGRGGLAGHAHQVDNHVKLVAAADPNAKALADFREKYGDDCFTTDDYRKLLERKDVHAIFITSPDFCHEEQALAALQAGKHVYLEKPMAITIDGCDRILDAAYRSKTKLYLGHNMRHMDFVQKMRELIGSGRIGELKAAWCRHFICYGGDAYFRDWHSERRFSTSLLLQKAAHDLDVIHWLCNGHSVAVNAMGALTVYDKTTNRRKPDEPANIWENWSKNVWPPMKQAGYSPIIDVEDLSMMNMQLSNGILACYQQCHYTPDAWRNYTFIGTEGRIENFGDAPGRCVVRLWNRRTDYNPYGDEQYFIAPTGGTHGGADERIVNEFIRFVRDGEKATTSPVAARHAVAAGCAATESLRSGGKPITVPELPKALVDYFAAQTL